MYKQVMSSNSKSYYLSKFGIKSKQYHKYLTGKYSIDSSGEKHYDISFTNHVVKEVTELVAMETVLKELINENGLPTEFIADIHTNKVCEVYWDLIRYKLCLSFIVSVTLSFNENTVIRKILLDDVLADLEENTEAKQDI